MKKYLPEFKYNIQLAYPIVLSMLGHTLVSVIDSIMVGKVGAQELAAASFASSMVFLGVSMIAGFSSVITPLVAKTHAEGDVDENQKILYNSVILCTLSGLLMFALLYGFKPFMYVMNQTKEVEELALPFLDVIAFSLIPLGVFQGFKQFFEGLSLTKYSMYATLISNVVNVFFNYVLIYGIWFLPKMGMMGAAYGTLLSRFVMLAYIVFVLFSQEKFRIYVQNISRRLWDSLWMKKVFNLGFPASMQSLFEVGLFTGTVWLSGMLGAESQAANQVALSIVSFTFMFGFGLSIAGVIRVGSLMGKKDYEKIQLVTESSLILTLGMYVFFALLLFLFCYDIPWWFLDKNDTSKWAMNEEVVFIGAKLLLIGSLFQIVDGVQVVILGILKGLQDMKIPMYITFVSYWVVGFGLSIFLAFYTPLKIEGIWYGLVGGLTTAASLLYWRYAIVIKRLRSPLTPEGGTNLEI